MKKSIIIIFTLLPFCFLFGQTELLHYVETTGYDHGTRAQSLSMFQELGTEFPFTVVQDNDGSAFDSEANLSRFAVVIFSNTSGANGLTATQRANFEKYIANGGSYLGIHAASDTYRHSSANGNNRGSWDWYAETVAGCSVQEGPNHTAQNFNADMTLIPSATQLDANLPNVWNKNEEWYYWENGYLSPSFTTLLTVEQTGDKSYDAARMAAHFRKLPGGGKAFYTSMGHNSNNFTSDTNFKQLMKNALTWILASGSTGIDESLRLRAKMNPRFINPAERELTLFAEIPQTMDLQVEVFDVAGRSLELFHKTRVETGEFVWRNELSLPKGLYVVVLRNEENWITSEKILLLE